jgi:hypothetical protein
MSALEADQHVELEQRQVVVAAQASRVQQMLDPRMSIDLVA